MGSAQGCGSLCSAGAAPRLFHIVKVGLFDLFFLFVCLFFLSALWLWENLYLAFSPFTAHTRGMASTREQGLVQSQKKL